ncbi:MAG: hypothetical protein GY774_38285 [Planctomycetes bacterium]|nr:hypothetical protein [Planctomycetota bacterium]
MTKLNKITRAVSLLIIIVAIMGCGIGYNKTLFFTKTNVGLDADSRPPTLEVTISRREGVIAPTFEDGNTPPVLASFSVDVNGVAALFAGISSTFAGGDAAVTMAKLYDDSDEDVESRKYKPSCFDSSIKLSEEPKYSDWFGNVDQSRKLLKKGEIEPFIFGTDTSFGLKVAWSGVTAQVPDTVKLGFNRKEFALAPVTLTPIPNTTDSKVRMPSFLATIDNSTRLGQMSETKIQHLQYFATGKAADLMARRYAVRKAMISRLDPIAAPGFREGLAGGILTRILVVVYDGLTKLSNEDDLIALEHLQKLDKLPETLEIPMSFDEIDLIHYTYISDSTKLEKTTNKKIRGDKFFRVNNYWSLLRNSIIGIRNAKKAVDEDTLINLETDSVSSDPAAVLPATEVEKLNSQLLRHIKIFKELDQKLRTDSDVIAAYRYFVSQISLE